MSAAGRRRLHGKGVSVSNWAKNMLIENAMECLIAYDEG